MRWMVLVALLAGCAAPPAPPPQRPAPPPLIDDDALPPPPRMGAPVAGVAPPQELSTRSKVLEHRASLFVLRPDATGPQIDQLTEFTARMQLEVARVGFDAARHHGRASKARIAAAEAAVADLQTFLAEHR